MSLATNIATERRIRLLDVHEQFYAYPEALTFDMMHYLATGDFVESVVLNCHFYAAPVADAAFTMAVEYTGKGMKVRLNPEDVPQINTECDMIEWTDVCCNGGRNVIEFDPGMSEDDFVKVMMGKSGLSVPPADEPTEATPPTFIERIAKMLSS
jgi:hypothetical protein